MQYCFIHLLPSFALRPSSFFSWVTRHCLTSDVQRAEVRARDGHSKGVREQEVHQRECHPADHGHARAVLPSHGGDVRDAGAPAGAGECIPYIPLPSFLPDPYQPPKPGQETSTTATNGGASHYTAYTAYSSTAAAPSAPSAPSMNQYSSCSPLAQKIMQYILAQPRTEEGVHVGAIARHVKANAESIRYVFSFLFLFPLTLVFSCHLTLSLSSFAFLFAEECRR